MKVILVRLCKSRDALISLYSPDHDQKERGRDRIGLWSWTFITSKSFTLGAHSQRGLQYLVCPSVCLSVTTCSATTRNKEVKSRHQCSALHWLDFKNDDFLKVLCSEVMAWKRENKPICYLIRLLCVPRRYKKPQRRARIDSRMLSATVAIYPDPVSDSARAIY